LAGKINLGYLIFLAATAALGGLLFGFDIGIITVPAEQAQHAAEQLVAAEEADFAAGRLAIHEAAGLFPDGLPFDIPTSDAAPPVKPHSA